MKLYVSLILLFLFQTPLLLYGNDTGVKKYVWAIHGLNLRSSPNIQANIVEILMFGDSVIVLETTNIPYSKKVIDTLYFYNEPLYLKSKWVKIRAGKNEGYVVHAYLMDIPCPIPEETINEYARRMAQRFTYSDLSYNLPIDGGQVVSAGSQCEFPDGKKLGFYIKEAENELLMVDYEKGTSANGAYLKKFTLQEMLIFLNPFYEIQE